MVDVKKYWKCPVKRDYATGQFVVGDDNKPVLEKPIRYCMLREETAIYLNKSWKSSGTFLDLDVEKEDQEEAELKEEAKSLGIKGAHLMKKDKLKEKINEIKEQ